DAPEFPLSLDTPIPTPNTTGWLTNALRNDNGTPTTAPSVVLDSIPSQSGRAETALWHYRHELGGLPAFHVTAPNDADPRIIDVSLSSWEASHRHVDAWIKYASKHPGEHPLWVTNNELKSLITRINSTDDATDAFT